MMITLLIQLIICFFLKLFLSIIATFINQVLQIQVLKKMKYFYDLCSIIILLAMMFNFIEGLEILVFVVICPNLLKHVFILYFWIALPQTCIHSLFRHVQVFEHFVSFVIMIQVIWKFQNWDLFRVNYILFKVNCNMCISYLCNVIWLLTPFKISY